MRLRECDSRVVDGRDIGEFFFPRKKWSISRRYGDWYFTLDSDNAGELIRFNPNGQLKGTLTGRRETSGCGSELKIYANRQCNALPGGVVLSQSFEL